MKNVELRELSELEPVNLLLLSWFGCVDHRDDTDRTKRWTVMEGVRCENASEKDMEDVTCFRLSREDAMVQVT